MNMQLHGVQNPKIAYQDSLVEDHATDIEAYSLVLGQPPVRRDLALDRVVSQIVA